MKIVHLSTYDQVGGAARAAYRIHKGIQALGEDSRMIVRYRSGTDGSVYGAVKGSAGRPRMPWAHLDEMLKRTYRRRLPGSWSVGRFGMPMVARVRQQVPDIVHVHWICNGFLSVGAIARLKFPLVWTFHDFWPFTGGCHIPGDCIRYRESCGFCPQLSSAALRDLSNRIWQRKRDLWKNLNITVVAPSSQLAHSVGESSLFKDCRVEIIHHGLDMTVFQPMNSSDVRRTVNLSSDKMIILTGAWNVTADPNKGYEFIKEAALRLASQGWATKAELVVFGSEEPLQYEDTGLRTTYLGRITDDRDLVSLFSAADVFVAPSRYEAFGLTLLEALACGTPCVAFAVGGIPDIVQHGRTGYLARPFEVEDLARGIARILGDANLREAFSREAQESTKKKFDIKIIASQYRQLYRDIRDFSSAA